MNPKLSTGLTTAIISVAIITTTLIEWRALYVREHPTPVRVDAETCTKCHSDAKTLKQMKLKEGNLHILFHGPDGPGGKL